MQYIKKPIFYTDFISMANQSGLGGGLTYSSSANITTGSSITNLSDNDPTNYLEIDCSGTNHTIYLIFNDIYQNNLNTINTPDQASGIHSLQILGHNLKNAGAKVSLDFDGSTAMSSPTKVALSVKYGDIIINTGMGGIPDKTYGIQENGSHIFELADKTQTERYTALKIEPSGANYNADIIIGSLRMGGMFTAPHAVNISEKHNHVKKHTRRKSLGGVHHSFRFQHNTTWYQNAVPFYNFASATNSFDQRLLSIPTANFSMEFSYVSESDYKKANSDPTKITTSSDFGSMYAQSLEGHLPLILQKDADENTSPSDFSWGFIDRFDATRIAPTLYNLSLDFIEAH